jgi:hypothetical protein
LRRQTILRELSVFLFFAALTVALTWPLASQMKTTVSDLGDPLFVTWIIDWVCHAIVHQPLHLYDAPIFHPGILPLAYSENLVAVALLVLPFHLAGLPPIVVYNIAFLLGFALSGYGAYVLARFVTRSTAGAIVGGIFYAFVPFKFDYLSHLQIIFSAWVPLLLAALLAFWEKPNWKRGSLLTLVLVANGLTNIYYLLFVAVAVIFTVIAMALLQPRDRKFYVKLASAGIAAVLILYPFLRPYRIVSKEYKYVRSLEDVRGGSATWTNWLVPSHDSRLYGHVVAEQHYAPERQLFPGLLIFFLTIIAIAAVPRRELEGITTSAEPPPRWHRVLEAIIFLGLALAWAAAMSDRIEFKLFGHRILSLDSSDIPVMIAFVAALIRFRKPLVARMARSRFSPGAWAAAVWIVVGILGSLGANSPLYVFFYRRFAPFQAMRVPARMAIIAYAGLAVWGALGVQALLEKRSGWKRPALAGALVALMIFEVFPRIRWEHVRAEVPEVYTWLKQTRIEPVVEFPFSGEGSDYLYLLGATTHRVKLVNGTSGFFPPEWWALRDADYKNEFDRMLDGLEGIGTRLIIVHGDLFNYERHQLVADFLRRNMASGRLQFLRRFDNEVFGDYVFAIAKNLPQWQRYRAPDVPDSSGRLPAQALDRFLSYQSTDNHIITVWTEMPKPYETVKGVLTVRGWAVSPYGVRRVTVLLQNDKLRFDTIRMPRHDVRASYPWMYYDDLPGFTVTIPERPANIPLDTSLMVEVVDNAGRVRRGRHVSFRWENADEGK